MPIISLIIVLAIIGVGLYLLNTYVPMAPPIKTIINVVAVIAVILWLLSAFGLLDGGPRIGGGGYGGCGPGYRGHYRNEAPAGVPAPPAKDVTELYPGVF